jgi:DNA (cytosine-5)-methyltransferase 1
MEFPYDRNSFKDRYTRQDRSNLCSTIVAHLKNDGLMFIHPTQVRSLTPREAARVQTFPDTFNFAGSRSHVFTQIGNAVPPLVGQKVGLGILDYLELSESKLQRAKLTDSELQKLIFELEIFVNDCMINPIEFVEDDHFKKAWKNIYLVLPHLHPESALDNGKEISSIPKRSTSFCLEPYFIRSGWPVELAPIALEAHRRHHSGRLQVTDYFHS